VPSPPPITL